MNRSEGNVEKRYKYFMSPYKKFAKFKGVPTPAKFPLPSSSSSHYGGSKPKEAVIEEDEDKENWYRAGDRWGHRRSQSFCQVCSHLHMFIKTNHFVYTKFFAVSPLSQPTNSLRIYKIHKSYAPVYL